MLTVIITAIRDSKFKNRHNVYMGNDPDGRFDPIGCIDVCSETCHFRPKEGLKYGREQMTMVNLVCEMVLVEMVLSTPNFPIHRVRQDACDSGTLGRE